MLHASSYNSVHTLGPGLCLCSAQGETELLSSRRLRSSQRASRSFLSRRARAGTWCPLAQRPEKRGAFYARGDFGFLSWNQLASLTPVALACSWRRGRASGPEKADLSYWAPGASHAARWSIATYLLSSRLMNSSKRRSSKNRDGVVDTRTPFFRPRCRVLGSI